MRIIFNKSTEILFNFELHFEQEIMDNDKNIRKAYFASGCFRGVEYFFSRESGVTKTTVGFMGGNVDNPTYQQVCTGTTGHPECVEVEYDAGKTSYENLVTLFKCICPYRILRFF